MTLVELMLIVAVVAIVAALVVPAIGQTGTMRLRQAAALLGADLDYAQLDSITHPDDPRLVVFEPNEHRYYIAASSSPAEPLTHPGDGTPYQTTFGQTRAAELSGVRILLANKDTNRIAFGPYGQLEQAATATVILATETHAVTLTIDPTTGQTDIADIIAR
jgi:Tfp pilus assembly protein FimT